MRDGREVHEKVLTCPVCQITQLLVLFRMPGSDFGDPAELVDIDPVGSGPFCECYESDAVDQSRYDERLLKKAVNAERLCGPFNHGPTNKYRKAVG